MIHVKRGDVPDGYKQKADDELEKAKKHFGAKEPPVKEFKFSAYSSDEIKKALNEAFGHKCAYCESRYIAMAPVDVEHYRPKGGVLVDGKIEKPGYWWLAAEWRNLLPSCIDCNRERKQEDPDGSVIKRGKANKFPLKDAAKRAKEPEEVDFEEPLLLDPCEIEEINSHLKFEESGIVKALTSAGQSTIDVLGLNRAGLVLERKAHAKKVKLQILRIRRVLRLATAFPTDVDLQHWLVDELAELRGMTDLKQPYAGLTKQLADDFLVEMDQHAKGG